MATYNNLDNLQNLRNYLFSVATDDDAVANGGKGLNSNVFASSLNSLRGSVDDDSLDSLSAYFLSYLQNPDARSIERTDLLHQLILQLLMNNEQRHYDEQRLDESRSYNKELLNEQRNFDSPTNILARMQAAGVSRDAALQLLGASGSSSGSGSLPGVGNTIGSSVGSMSSLSAPSGTSALAQKNSKIQQQATIMQGLSSLMESVSALFNNGMSAMDSLQNYKLLSAQNYMTKEQIQSYDSVKGVTDFLHRSLLDGTIERADADKWKNVDDVYKYLMDNKDRVDVAPLFKSGMVGNAFTSPYGAKLFNDHWFQRNNAKYAGQMFVEEARQQQLRGDILSLDKNKLFADFQRGWTDLIKRDKEISLLDQQFKNGEIEILINGKRLEIASSEASVASFDALVAETEKKVYDDVMNQTGSEFGQTGAQLLTQYQWTQLWEQIQKQAVLHQTPEEWQTWLENNRDIAFNLARIKASFSRKTALNMVDEQGDPSGFFGWMGQIIDLFVNSGLDDVISFGGKAAVNYGLRRSASPVNFFYNARGQR